MVEASDHDPAGRRSRASAHRPPVRPGPSNGHGDRPGERQPQDLPILTITVNPALDMTVRVPRVVPGRKLRCGPPLYEPGGGGVNVSRAIRELGGTSRAFLALAGATGEHYRRLLDMLEIDIEVWPIEGETRISLTVLETDARQHYRFLLPGPPIDDSRAAALLAEARRQIGLRSGLVVVSGSPLPGLPIDFAGQLAAHARSTGSRAIVDISGDALKGALEHRPFLVRMNHLEAQELVGIEGAERDAEPLAHRAARQIVAQGGAENVIVTVGAAGAILVTAQGLFQYRPPYVEVVSAVGAGDSFVAALALGLAQGWSLTEACRFGVAAAASAVTGHSTELCKRPQTLRLLNQVTAVSEPATG